MATSQGTKLEAEEVKESEDVVRWKLLCPTIHTVLTHILYDSDTQNHLF